MPVGLLSIMSLVGETEINLGCSRSAVWHSRSDVWKAILPACCLYTHAAHLSRGVYPRLRNLRCAARHVGVFSKTNLLLLISASPVVRRMLHGREAEVKWKISACSESPALKFCVKDLLRGLRANLAQFFFFFVVTKTLSDCTRYVFAFSACY